MEWLTDLIVPMANVVLAGAAVFAAIMSWRTARAANRQTEEHWREEREATELRWRRTRAVDIREWFEARWLNALFDVHDDESLSTSHSTIKRECEIAGEADGKRLVAWLSTRAYQERQRFASLSPKEKAKAMHPSQRSIWYADESEMIDKWVDDPASVRSFLDANDRTRIQHVQHLMEEARLKDESQTDSGVAKTPSGN